MKKLDDRDVGEAARKLRKEGPEASASEKALNNPGGSLFFPARERAAGVVSETAVKRKAGYCT